MDEDRDPNMTSPDISVDYERWARAEKWNWEETEYLLAGVDHFKVVDIDPDVELDLRDAERKAVRKALEFHFRSDPQPSRIPPALAIEVAKRAGIAIPQELADAVERFAEPTQADNVTKGRTKTPRESDLQRKLGTAQSLLLGLAIEKYRYVPQQRGSVPRNISDSMERVGLSVTEDTVRQHLREAEEALSAEELEKLKGLRKGK